MDLKYNVESKTPYTETFTVVGGISILEFIAGFVCGGLAGSLLVYFLMS